MTRVTFQGPMAFEGVTETGHRVMMDAGDEVGGNNQGARPMELVLVALGGCTGMDVVSILRKMRVDIQSFSMEVEADRAQQHPKVYQVIRLAYRFEADAAAAPQVVRAVTLSQERYCSVSAMLSSGAHIVVDIYLNGDKVGQLEQGGA